VKKMAKVIELNSIVCRTSPAPHRKANHK
jgi:hypothetical protein